jgi:hypothetical protein
MLAPALEIYDLFLRYYVEGLRWAGSPYAHHSLGSIISVRAESYAHVRGFPKREAGEDFYFLNKLAKVGRIEENLGNPVRIQGRLSERVPFGTGAMVGEYSELLASGRDILFYNPLIFVLLKSWLDLFKPYSEAKGSEFLRDAIEANSSMKELQPALEKLEALASLEDLWKKSKNPASRLKHFHDWFDGFRTLRLIHEVRDTQLPSLPWDQAIASLNELTGGTGLHYKGPKERVS